MQLLIPGMLSLRPPTILESIIARDERGLEDLGIGYCNTDGVGWNGNVTTEIILGQSLTDDWIIVSAKYQAGSGNESQTGNMTSLMNIPLHWTKLVRRPKCMDRITVRVGNVIQGHLTDPADFEDSKETSIIEKNICETEAVNIQIENRRGGFDAQLSNVNLIRRQPYQNFQFNFTLDGIIDIQQLLLMKILVSSLSIR